MDKDLLIAHGNTHREQNNPQEALKCYAACLLEHPDFAPGWNNYGNVLRELGQPARSIPFLQHAALLDPTNPTTKFNLAVSYLLMGDYEQGWPAYEARWNYEHLAGTMPAFQQPQWTGQDLNGKTILVMGEQGHGDCIQFSRFVFNLHQLGARVLMQVTDGLIPMFQGSDIISWVGGYNQSPPEFDYWVPIMSLPGLLNVRVNNIPKIVSYLGVSRDEERAWFERLGPKKNMRIGLCWSGRRDTWINRHKGMPFNQALELIRANPNYEWINLQVDATEEESQQLEQAGVHLYPGSIVSFRETAALMMNLDVVIGVDTAVSHLSGALGRPTWIMLNHYALDWRWLLNRDDSPWYITAKLFRQPSMGDWDSVIQKITQWLKLFKV